MSATAPRNRRGRIPSSSLRASFHVLNDRTQLSGPPTTTGLRDLPEMVYSPYPSSMPDRGTTPSPFDLSYPQNEPAQHFDLATASNLQDFSNRGTTSYIAGPPTESNRGTTSFSFGLSDQQDELAQPLGLSLTNDFRQLAHRASTSYAADPPSTFNRATTYPAFDPSNPQNEPPQFYGLSATNNDFQQLIKHPHHT